MGIGLCGKWGRWLGVNSGASVLFIKVNMMWSGVRIGGGRRRDGYNKSMARLVVTTLVNFNQRLPTRLNFPNEIFQILSLTILEKTLVFELFSETRQPDHKGHVHKQLSLFE